VKRLLIVLVLLGCTKVPLSNITPIAVPAPPVSVQLSDAQKIMALRQEAKNRGLQWHIFCTGNTDIDINDSFQGTAWHRGVEDDDETDRWMETGTTQAIAAYKLYLSIQGPPTHPAQRKRNPKNGKTGEICEVPELIGR
jgi:hypothetical protein